MYGKIKDDKLIYAPVNYLTSEGKMIFNFNENVEAMKANGFEEVIDKIPKYDENLYKLKFDGYNETATNIIVVYTTEPLELTPEQKKAYEQKLALTFLGDMLTDEQALQVPSIFSEWKADVAYKTGTKLLYNGVLYKVLQDHNSQADWTPDKAPSLFAKVINETLEGDIPDWVQPDSTNPYMKGDKVKFEGKVYESLIDNNTWSPTDYPTGWKELSQ